MSRFSRPHRGKDGVTKGGCRVLPRGAAGNEMVL